MPQSNRENLSEFVGVNCTLAPLSIVAISLDCAGLAEMKRWQPGLNTRK
jgi:hypothetical protein